MALFQKVSGGVSHTGRLSLEAFDEFNGQTVDAEVQEAALTGETDFVEAAQEAERVSADLDDAQQSMVVADSVQDQIDVQDQVENTTETEAMLAETARATATAALGVAPGEAEEVISGESWVGGRLSTEGFKEFLASVWAKIKEFVGNIVLRIKTTWKKFFNGTARLVKRAKALKEKLKDKKKDLKSDAKIKPIAALANTNSGKFDVDFIAKEMSQIVSAAEKIGGNTLEAIGKVKKIVDDNAKTDNVKDVASEADVNAKIKTLTEGLDKGLGSVANTGFSIDKRFGSGATVKYRAMPFGNKAAFVVIEKGAKTLSEAINGTSVKFETLHKSFNTGGKDVEHKPLAFGDIEKIPADVEKAAKALETFFEKTTGKAHDEINAIEKSLNEFVGKANEIEGAFAKQTAQGLQRLYVLPTHILRAAMSESSYLVSTLGAYVTLGETSLAQYEDDKKDK